MVTICTASLTFNNFTFYPHSVFMCFVWIWEQTVIISLYKITWIVFITDLALHSPVVTICNASLKFNNSTFCPKSIFVCFVWIWEQTAINSPYSIKWLVFITEFYIFAVQWSLYIPPVYHSTILRSAHTVYLCVLCGSQNKKRLFPYTALTDWLL